MMQPFVLILKSTGKDLRGIAAPQTSDYGAPHAISADTFVAFLAEFKPKLTWIGTKSLWNTPNAFAYNNRHRNTLACYEYS
jgi:hypothetical protein